MDIIFYVVVPIITSVLGGLIGGLFTFLGVKLTIKHDDMVNKKLEQEKNQEKNKKIIASRPEFSIVHDQVSVEREMELFLLPYFNPKLTALNTIYFDYDSLDFEDDFWSCKTIILVNKGKKTIKAGFLQLDYKSNVNIYSRYELISWRTSLVNRNYYSDILGLPAYIHPNEYIALKIYYPKNIKDLYEINLNCYMIDEFENYWKQELINKEVDCNISYCVSPDEYIMHYRDNYYGWLTFDRMYHDKKIKKCFNPAKIEDTLSKTLQTFRSRENKNSRFINSIYNGEQLLKSQVIVF